MLCFSLILIDFIDRAHATKFVALHAPEILHSVAMKNFRAIQRKICHTNVQQNRFDSIFAPCSLSVR